MAAEGKSDREIAMALNAAGYRTAGNQGNRLFSKDTVKGILQNRFYVGELSDGNGGCIRAKHEALVPLEVFEAAQRARELNRNNSARTTRADARLSSLSGVARCAVCGATLRSFRARGTTRPVCNTRIRNGECCERSARLNGYDEQLGEYLAAWFTASSLVLLILGGAVYTLDGIVYAIRKPNPWLRVFGYHEIFHLLVILGSTLHYSLVAIYVLPS